MGHAPPPRPRPRQGRLTATSQAPGAPWKPFTDSNCPSGPALPPCSHQRGLRRYERLKTRQRRGHRARAQPVCWQPSYRLAVSARAPALAERAQPSGSAAPCAPSSPGPAPFPLPPHLRSHLPRLTALHLEALMPASEPVDLALLIGQEALQLPLHQLGQLGELGPLKELLQHRRHLGGGRCAPRPYRHRRRSRVMRMRCCSARAVWLSVPAESWEGSVSLWEAARLQELLLPVRLLVPPCWVRLEYPVREWRPRKPTQRTRSLHPGARYEASSPL